MWTAEKRNNSAIHLGYPSNAAQLINEMMIENFAWDKLKRDDKISLKTR